MNSGSNQRWLPLLYNSLIQSDLSDPMEPEHPVGFGISATYSLSREKYN